MKSSLKKPAAYPHRVEREKLDDANTELLSFFFRYGANIYVFSYEKNGVKRHTFIDTGYLDHRKRLLPILKDNGVDLKSIDQIIITHRHSDHCGLASVLAAESGARILVHANFKDFVEGKLSRAERIWLGNLELSRLKECEMVYLDPAAAENPVGINGVNFPRLGKPIAIGESGKLEILACPQSDSTHSPDQLVALYSSGTDDYTMLFSGDLWLMRGPIFERNMRILPKLVRFGFYRLIDRLWGNNLLKFDPQAQDVAAKEALKLGFSLIRGMPGHGEEFHRCRIVPNSLPARRDLLLRLGYGMNDDPSLLSSESLAPKIADIMENAYAFFKDELLLWNKQGCGTDEITELLLRIYKEQCGGGPLVEMDRKERREQIKETLARLGQDNTAPPELRQLWKPNLYEKLG